MTEQTTRDLWEIQGFIAGYGDGRAAWSTGVDGIPAALAYLATALDDSDTMAFLVRRGPQVEADDGTIGPWRLVSTDARERLARHLYMRGSALEREAGDRWDAGEVPADRMDDFRRSADEMLAVITGTKEN